MATLYASFADASLAEKAAGALLDYGARSEDISLVAHDEYGRTRTTHGTVGQTAADTTAGVGRGVSNVGDSAVDATKSAGNRVAQAGDRVAGAVAGAVGADRAAANYEVSGDVRAANAETRAAMAGNEPAVHGSAADASGRHVAVYDANDPNATAVMPRGDVDAMDRDDATVDDHSHTELAAKSGISTTTPGDAEAGAVKGAEWGLGLGIIAGLASLLIPGVGLVVGGGALATAIGGAVGTTVAGAVAGGVTGYLKDQGVPDEAVQRYHGAVEHGGAMLAVNLPSGNVDQATAEQVLSKYGAADVNTY